MNAKRLHHCRNCRRETTQALVREIPVASQIVYDDGSRPELDPAELWRCYAAVCGIEILAFRDLRSGRGVPDAEGLCLTVLNERLRGRHAEANGYRDGQGLRARVDSVSGLRVVEAVGTPSATAKRLDWEDALGHLREHVFVAYSRFDPARRVPLRAWTTGWLRNRLSDWLRGEIGRNVPKLHATADSYEELLEGDGPEDSLFEFSAGGPADGYRSQDAFDRAGTGLAETLAAREGDPAMDCSPDLAWALGL